MESSSATPLSRTVEEAANAWARGVFGAPRDFASLITSVESRDEVLERVVTEIVRRDIREQRIPCNRRSPTPARIDPARVDPFTVTVEQLRAQSEHVTPCGYCNGAGIHRCPGCEGAGRIACSSCRGSGKEVKYYKTTTRLINCKACRASGTEKCGRCGATGSVTCIGCSGSGNQLAWLSYDQESRWVVSVMPDSPVTASHPQLAEPRFLALSELDDFAILATEQGDGAVTLRGYRDQDTPALRAVSTSLDPRTERIHRQQYHRLSVVRRDAVYAMCGTKGTLVLAGRDLRAATTKAAVRPIQARIYGWAASGVATGIGLAVLATRFSGASSYFSRTRPMVEGLAVAAAAALTVAIGGILRALQPRFKFGPIRRYEKRLAIAGLALIAITLVVGVYARPRTGEIAAALRMGDRARAREVLDALKETVGESDDVKDAEDSILIADANAAAGEGKLALLDRVAARQGKLASEAQSAARAERVRELHEMLDARKPGPTIAALERWWSNWRTDGELAGIAATAHDLAAEQCVNAACRFEETSLAKGAAPTSQRETAVTAARSALLDALAIADVPGETTLQRLQRLRTLASAAKKTASLAASEDSELREIATKAQTWSESERAKSPLLGAEITVLEELLGSTATYDVRGPSFTLDAARAFVVVDSQKRCRGIYAVGEKEGARAIHVATAERLLSQATGHAAKVNKPSAASETTARWFDVNAMVTARWKGDQLIELRIGDAAPWL